MNASPLHTESIAWLCYCMIFFRYAQLKFQTREDVIKALKNPKCRTLNGQNLQFAMAVHHSNQGKFWLMSALFNNVNVK